MTAASNHQSAAPKRKRTARHVGSLVCAFLFFLTFTLGVTSIWARVTVFDSARFAQRAEKILDSDGVRTKLADELTDAIVNSGPSNLASFRTVIRTSLDPIMQTPAFRSIFRRALATGHGYIFTKSGNTAVINLSEGLGVLSGSLQATNPDLANSIPAGSSQLLVKIGDNTRGLGLWRIAEKLTYAGIGLSIAAAFFALATIFLDSDRRRSVFESSCLRLQQSFRLSPALTQTTLTPSVLTSRQHNYLSAIFDCFPSGSLALESYFAHFPLPRLRTAALSPLDRQSLVCATPLNDSNPKHNEAESHTLSYLCWAAFS